MSKKLLDVQDAPRLPKPRRTKKFRLTPKQRRNLSKYGFKLLETLQLILEIGSKISEFFK